MQRAAAAALGLALDCIPVVCWCLVQSYAADAAVRLTHKIVPLILYPLAAAVAAHSPLGPVYSPTRVMHQTPVISICLFRLIPCECWQPKTKQGPGHCLRDIGQPLYNCQHPLLHDISHCAAALARLHTVENRVYANTSVSASRQLALVGQILLVPCAAPLVLTT
jgi:hypothetical protein